MLEARGVLRTWRLSAPPKAGVAIAATASFDHRAIYLDYEGPVSGNRGAVQRWDAGDFVWQSDTPERVAVRLAGRRLNGLAILETCAAGDWSLLFEFDAR